VDERSERRMTAPIIRHVVPEQGISKLFVRIAIGGKGNSHVFAGLGKRLKRGIRCRLTNLDVSGSSVKFVVSFLGLFQSKSNRLPRTQYIALMEVLPPTTLPMFGFNCLESRCACGTVGKAQVSSSFVAQWNHRSCRSMSGSTSSPPASSSRHEECRESFSAHTQPAAPAPTTIKSNVFSWVNDHILSVELMLPRRMGRAPISVGFGRC